MKKELVPLHGIVIHKISPFEQKAMPHFWSRIFPNTLRRISGSVWRFLLQFVIAATVIYTIDDMHAKTFRKDPAMYVNDGDDDEELNGAPIEGSTNAEAQKTEE
jgi:ubiquinol-cytochrome c reductase subunit 8